MKELREKALTLLARREHSRLELRRKLRDKGSSEVLEDLLEKIAAEGLQSEERFTEVFVRSRMEAGYGPVRISQELMQRGIDKELIQALLPDDAGEWQRRLQAAWKKKYHNSKPSNQKELARQVRFLLSRGFSHSMIMKLLAGSETHRPWSYDT